jgi:hypothetical protein
MREPNFSESLQFSEALQPLLAELVGGGPRTIAALTRVMHRHRGALFPLIAQCAGVGTAWIEEIGDVEGKKLALLFWKVNASFFGRLLVQTQAGTEGA